METDSSARHAARVIVKFKSAYVQGNEIPYDDRVEQDPERYFGQNWANLVRPFRGLTIKRTVTSLTPAQLVGIVRDAKIEAERRGLTYPHPDNLFLTYFALEVPSSIVPMAVAEAWRSWEAIELAYVEGTLTMPSGPEPGTTGEDIDHYQQYLGPAPVGIDAKYAWTKSGGDGDVGSSGMGLRFADLEQGWLLQHEDLPQGIQGIWGSPGPEHTFGGGDVAHGTLVLGILLALPNGIGCVGITPNVTTSMVTSCWPGNTPGDVANAIAAAVPPDDSKLRSGDVLLLEAQMTDEGGQVVPIEVDSQVFQWIWNATTRGIVVVEAAGNGGLDLDTYTRFSVPLLNRGSAQFQESFAIMVGAAGSSVPHDRLWLSNYGNRIDCYAWGEKVYSTGGDGNYGYLNDTSAAAAIIAGSASAVQGFGSANLQRRFYPADMRNILSDWKRSTPCDQSTGNTLSATSTYPKDPANPLPSEWNAKKIGVMPNLHSIIEKLCVGIVPPSPPTGVRIS